MEKRYPAPLGGLHVPQCDLPAANPQFLDRQYARYLTNASPQKHSPARASRKSLDPSVSPPFNRRETPLSMSSPSVHRSNIPSSLAGRRSMTSMSPPLLDRGSSQQPMSEPLSGAESRLLPSREIDDTTIDDAYTAFILYCNPNVPLSVDTGELRKVFRSPPRSDGKSFSIFTLWELIGKLERKELKTWIQLAIELGVEPPSAEKKQSTQKVQQYAVRLKVGFIIKFLPLLSIPPQTPDASNRDGCEQCMWTHSLSTASEIHIHTILSSLRSTARLTRLGMESHWMRI
jgi:hypothetical protein